MFNIIDFRKLENNTPIKELPEYINNNNEKIDNFCLSTFKIDNSNHYILTVGVNTGGNVTAESGHFKNLKFESLDDAVINNSSIFTGITTNHDNAINRFTDNLSHPGFKHDAAGILFEGSVSVYDKIIKYDASIIDVSNRCTAIESSIELITERYNDLIEKLNIQNQVTSTDETNMTSTTYNMRRSSMNENTNTDADLVYTYNQNANSYTYSNKIYSTSDISQCVYEWDKYDIMNNNKFRYYKITNDYYTKINNQYKCVLNTENIGQETTLIIDKNSNNDLYIRLSYDGNSYEYVKIKYDDIDLARITLVCINKTIYGPVWYIKNYNGNITLEKIEK